MTTTMDPVEHRVPRGAEVLAPVMCSNCTRRLYRIKDDKIFCLDCGTVNEPHAQIWMCVKCRTGRKWGEGTPVDHEGNPVTNPRQAERFLIGCIRCGEPTEHKFSHVA